MGVAQGLAGRQYAGDPWDCGPGSRSRILILESTRGVSGDWRELASSFVFGFLPIYFDTGIFEKTRYHVTKCILISSKCLHDSYQHPVRLLY